MSASIQSLQEQVDNLYAHTSAVRTGQDHNGILHHDPGQYPPNPSLEDGTSQDAFHQSKKSPRSRARHSQFQGPTSTAFNFEVANSSLQTMGITQAEPMEENGSAFDRNPAHSSYPHQAPTAPMAMHPSKDPLWSISKAEAIRLCGIYDEEMGVMYPVVDIVDAIEKADLLFTFTESATRIGLISARLPGRDGLGTDDNNILKMILATALTVEGSGQSEMGHKLFQSVRDTSHSLWEPVDLKGLTLVVLVVCKTIQNLDSNFIADWSQAQYHFHTDDEVLAYRVIGLAARLSLEMGLHRRESLAKKVQDEKRRSQATRLFWSIYVLDRRWSFGTGMPFAIRDDDIDPVLPKPVSLQLFTDCQCTDIFRMRGRLT